MKAGSLQDGLLSDIINARLLERPASAEQETPARPATEGRASTAAHAKADHRLLLIVIPEDRSDKEAPENQDSAANAAVFFYFPLC